MKFEAGKTYYTRSVCDHNCIVRVEVIGRTAKTIKARVGSDLHAKTMRPGVNVAGHEFVKPWGSYSMCPIVEATDTRELFPDYNDGRRVQPAPTAAL